MNLFALALSEKLPWYLVDPNSKLDLLNSIISCPGCKNKQGSYKAVYDRKESFIFQNGIGVSSCSFCGCEYKLFTSAHSHSQ